MKKTAIALCTGFLALAQVASADSVIGETQPQKSFPASTLAAGKLGIIGDSLAAGTHSSQMCGNKDIVDCMDNTLAKNSYEWSYAGGVKSWSIATLLGYSFDRVVNASVGGEEWKDALNQAKYIMNDPEIKAVFINLGVNDVCQPYGYHYTESDLQIIEQHIDDTLQYLTNKLPQGGKIYWSGVLDVGALQNIMVNRDHNYVFKSCQAMWDLDGGKIKEDAIADACDHYYDHRFCQFATYLDATRDLLLKLIVGYWLALEGIEEGPCGKILNSRSTPQDREEARQFSIKLNRLMAQKAQAYNGKNGIAVYYNDRVFSESSTLQPQHVSRLDCFHPSRAGQMKLATEIWRGFNPGYAPVQKLAVEEFALQDYCNDFTTWGTCWAESGESDGPTAGDIQIQNQELRVKNNNKGVARGVNLEGVVEAWLSFNWRRESLDDSNDYVSLDISPNGGGTWYSLDRFKGDADDYGTHRGYYYNITPYANANTRIRLLSSRDLGGSDKVYFDNVEMVGWSEARQSIDLQRGFNLVSVNIPMDVVAPTAFALLNSIGPEATVASLQRFNPTTGRFETATYLNAQPMGVDFLIHPSEGYIVHLNQPASSPGFSHLQRGFNLVTAAIESRSVNMTAFALLRAIGDATVVSSIQRFNAVTGQFEEARYENNQPVGVDFPIDPREGYIIYMQQDRPGFRP